MANPPFTIEAIQLEDVPHIADIGADSFHGDRHTEMKTLGKEPYDHKQTMLDMMPGFVKHTRLVCLKAVDVGTGEIMGYCNWGFRGFTPKEMPAVTGRIQPDELSISNEPDTTPDEETATADDPIKRLGAITDADMAAWVEEIMPLGVRCLYVVMLSVSPRFQGRGVGSALLRWGLDRCDSHNVFAWVHSSEPAYGMYEKLGFHTVRSLDLNLDDYAPCPPPNEGLGARWGRYIFRYMKYIPRRADNSHDVARVGG